MRNNEVYTKKIEGTRSRDVRPLFVMTLDIIATNKTIRNGRMLALIRKQGMISLDNLSMRGERLLSRVSPSISKKPGDILNEKGYANMQNSDDDPTRVPVLTRLQNNLCFDPMILPIKSSIYVIFVFLYSIFLLLAFPTKWDELRHDRKSLSFDITESHVKLCSFLSFVFGWVAQLQQIFFLV